jgi:hypothetical protein
MDLNKYCPHRAMNTLRLSYENFSVRAVYREIIAYINSSVGRTCRLVVPKVTTRI